MKYTARPLTRDDLEMVRHWRMDPDVTRYMLTDPVITPEQQVQWFERVSADPTMRYWIVEADGKPVALMNMANLDIEEKSASFGYYVGEREYRSMALAAAMELSFFAYCFEDLGLERVFGDPLSNNLSTLRLHERFGATLVEIQKAVVVKNGEPLDRYVIVTTRDSWAKKHASRFQKLDLAGTGEAAL